MSTLFSTQFNNAYNLIPPVNIPPGDVSGDVRFAAFDITLAGAVTSVNTLKLCKLPRGAKLIGVLIRNSALGAGTINFGWSASPDGAQGASASGVVGALAVTSAATNFYYPNVELAGEVDLQGIPVVSTSAGGTISGYALYVVV